MSTSRATSSCKHEAHALTWNYCGEPFSYYVFLAVVIYSSWSFRHEPCLGGQSHVLTTRAMYRGLSTRTCLVGRGGTQICLDRTPISSPINRYLERNRVWKSTIVRVVGRMVTEKTLRSVLAIRNKNQGHHDCRSIGNRSNGESKKVQVPCVHTHSVRIVRNCKKLFSRPKPAEVRT